MRCPNCGLESPEGTEECPKCQIVFRKWEERQVRRAVEEYAEMVKEKSGDSSATVRLFVMFLVCAGLYWLVKPSEKQAAASAAPEQPPAAEQAVQQAQDAQRLAAAGPAESRWSFEGRVVDLLHAGPVIGAKLYFSEPATGRNFSAETDYEGRYSLELRPLEQGGYQAQVIHPDFGGRWWDGKSVKLPRKQRYQLAAGAESPQPACTGKPGAAVTLDFAVFPASLGAEEKKELCAAAPKSPDCSN